MNIENLKTWYNKPFNSQLKGYIRRELLNDSWFAYYFDFISYDEEIGWLYAGEVFDNISQIKKYIIKHESIKQINYI